MTSSRTLLVLAAFSLLSDSSLAQAPANDLCSNAAVIAEGLTPIDLTMATTTGAPLIAAVCDVGPAGDEQIYQDVWFSFTASSTTSFDFEVVDNGNPAFDSRIAIYDQSTCPDNPMNVIGCDDDAGPGTRAAVFGLPLTIGSTYLIRVGAFSPATTVGLAGLEITSAPVVAVPANDDCMNASMVTVGLTPFDSRGATDGTGLALDPIVCDVGAFGDEQIYQDVWFTFSPTATDAYDIAVINNGNPTFDSRLAIYNQSGCPDDPANVIACDDDAGPGTEALMPAVPLVMGTTYLIRAGSFDAATDEEPAALAISVFVPPLPPANDDCDNAVAIMVGNTFVDTTQATDGAGLELDISVCDMGPFGDEQIYADIWFLFTAPTTDTYTFGVMPNGGPPFDSRLALYDQSMCPDDPANVIACDDDAGPGTQAELALVPLMSGQTYLLRMGSYGPGTTEEVADISIAAVTPPMVPANDDCMNAAVAMTGLTPFNSAGATDGAGLELDPLVCDFGGFGDDQIYQDVWFTFTPDTTTSYDIAIVNNGNPEFDSRLAVYNQSTCPDDPANVIACDDDSGPGLEAEVTSLPLTAGTTYLIRLGSFDGGVDEEPAALSIMQGVVIVPPANDDCANAELIPSTGTYAFDNTFATTDGADLAGFCDLGAFGDEVIYFDVWYHFTPADSECFYITTFNLAGFDTRLAVYDTTTCPDVAADAIACSDDEVQPTAAPFEAGLDVELIAGTQYLIRLGTFSAGTPGAPGMISISSGAGAFMNDQGTQPGAPGCGLPPVYTDFCNGNGGNQQGCTDCPCSNNAPVGTIGGCLNSSFRSTRLTVTGDPSVSLPAMDTTDVRFSVDGGPPQAWCLLTSGDAVSPTNAANPCFGLNTGITTMNSDGLQCVDSNVSTHGGRRIDTNGDVGTTNSPWGGEGPPNAGIGVAGGFGAGQTRYFQAIHREDTFAVCNTGLNSSQAVEVMFRP